jgi:signal transduction histidine kinase
VSDRRLTGRRRRLALRAALLLAAASAVLLLAVGAAALVSGRMPGDGTWTVAPVVAAAIVGAALWWPARRWARRTESRLLLGSARSPEDVVHSFGRRASREVPDDELLDQLAEALVRSLRAASAEVWRLDADGRMARAVAIPSRGSASVPIDDDAHRVLAGGGVVGRAWLEMWLPALLDGRPLGEVRVAPATHAGQLLGLVVVSRLASADRFAEGDDASLAELGNRLGVVLHNRALDATLQQTLDDLRRTNEELRASRVRLVSTADAERRRIERNLHDGAQQHLVALAVNLRLAADEIAEDPTRAADVFAGLGADVREAINELRSLAHGIYPPLLMDAGLVEALRVSAQRSPSSVTVHADGVRRYATETEAAVYFCCMEALQNAAKHAPGAAVRVALSDDGAFLRFAVDDDGPGIADDAVQHGHGLGNMVDRVVAVGGALAAGRSASGGTRIEGRVPIGPPANTDGR